MQNIWLHPERVLILSTCADSVQHLYRTNADPEHISRFRSQKLHCFIQPTIRKPRYSMLKSHRTKQMQENTCCSDGRLVLIVCTWVQSLSQLRRAAGGRRSSIQRLTAQTCRTNRGRRRRREKESQLRKQTCVSLNVPPLGDGRRMDTLCSADDVKSAPAAPGYWCSAKSHFSVLLNYNTRHLLPSEHTTH